ncbi:MAG: LPS-assembly protein LptD [Oceanicaulis sp.]|uniref:LPS-assembly protein LptD n=1 Tax=Glycocaulis sp. TaxID=1969725 RepID=UPI0025C13965|nr:LPS assembly protein LptD [Glycocaulis sp.]MCC5981432.1 LPS-assembly protein LptD [Oceanicaulis sp.]MCH8521742.1 LPS assembly protein LptD [Glycocaulis sp.]
MKLPFTTACAAAALLWGMGEPVLAQGDGRSDDPVYIDAADIEQDRENAVLYARGNVQMQSGDRLLFADEVEYRTEEGRVIARGNVRLHDGAGSAQTADEIELANNWTEGIATGFAMLLESNGRAASAYAVRRPTGVVNLIRAYYTACNLCEDGSRRPTWRIAASEVTQDPESEMIYYRDARLEVLGAPIIYSPAFAHADPSAPRKSGFLIPSVDLSNRLGFSYQQPYYWAISPHHDVVIAPKYMANYNPIVRFDYRRRFWSGEMRLRGSFTNETEFDRDGRFGDQEWRGHLMASGGFDITRDWRWGFNIQQVSDPLYLNRYGLLGEMDRRSTLGRLNRRRILPSEAFVLGRTDRYFFNASTIRFQSLRRNVSDSTLPFIAPMVEAEYRVPLPAWAGNFNLKGSGVWFTRDIGEDYARATGQIDWSRAFTLPGGVRAIPFATARGDLYRYTVTSGGNTETIEFDRSLASAGMDISWPFVRPGAWGDIVLAPRVQLVASTGVDADAIAPGEDSVGLELNATNLFARNRSNGYDIWEEGTRVNAGLTASFHTATPVLPDVTAFAGRSYRIAGDASFGPGSGLDAEESDWVANLDVNFGDMFTMGTQARLDSVTGETNRVDFYSTVAAWRVTASVTYSLVDDVSVVSPVRESMTVRGSLQLADNWYVGYRGTRDLGRGVTRRQDLSLIYRDECTDVRIVYDARDFDIGNLGESRAISIRVTLFTLGSITD